MHLLRVLRQNRLSIVGPIRCLCDGKPKNETDPNHPFVRTGNLLKRDMKDVKNFFLPQRKILGTTEVDIRDIRTRANDKEFQSHCDIVIIGGGGVGASIAYWLKKRGLDGVNVVVLEKDPTVRVFLIFLDFTVKDYSFLDTVSIGVNNPISRRIKATIFAGRKHSNELVCR